MMTFNEYLLQKGEAFNTVRMRENTIKQFTNWLNDQEIGIKSVDYTTVLNYVEFCKSKQNVVRTIRSNIKSLSHYFEYLIEINQLKSNAAKLVQLKGVTKTLPTKLLDTEELQTIYELQTTYGLVEKRNKVLLSLVVFQAVGSRELAQIEVTNIDLNNGTIYVPGLRTTNGRTLELKPQQLLLFQDYLMNVRPSILEKSGKKSDRFLISTGSGQGSLTNVISFILRSLRVEYPRLKDLQQIRQSVVSQWVKVHGSRKAQYMAGHKYVSSTERYNTSELDELKKSIKSCFPLC
jgi:site-specific recombinase XerD